MRREAPHNPESQSRTPAAFEVQWRRRFRNFAELRDDDAGIAGWSASGLEARLRHFLAFWKGVRLPSVWLDAGCGAGTYSRLLARQGAEVVSIDYSILTIEKARARTEGGAWVVADVTRLPFRSGEFDGILCLGVMQALSESEPGIRELYAGLRPGGELWIDALNSWCLPHVWGGLRRRAQGKPLHLRYESPRGMQRALRRVGFENVRLHWMPILPGRFGRSQRLLEHRAARFLLRWVPLLGACLSHSFLVVGEKPALSAHVDAKGGTKGQ